MLIGIRLLLWAVVLIMTAGQALAAGSGAYRLEVPDAGAAGMGSAFVGEANTPAAVYWNPAGLTQIVGQAAWSTVHVTAGDLAAVLGLPCVTDRARGDVAYVTAASEPDDSPTPA